MFSALAIADRRIFIACKDRFSLQSWRFLRARVFPTQLAALGVDVTVPLDVVLQRVVDLIPPAWQYPAETCGRLTFGDLELQTANFRRTEWRQSSPIVIPGDEPGVVEVFYLSEMDRKQTEQALARRQRQQEALYQGARAALAGGEFSTMARSIFDSAQEATGALSGYVALLSESREGNQLLFFESGGLQFSVDSSLPMPIRGLRAVAYEAGDLAKLQPLAGGFCTGRFASTVLRVWWLEEPWERAIVWAMGALVGEEQS